MATLDDFRDHVHSCERCSQGPASMCPEGAQIGSTVEVPDYIAVLGTCGMRRQSRAWCPWPANHDGICTGDLGRG